MNYDAATLRAAYSPAALRQIRAAVLADAWERRQDHDYRWSGFLRRMNGHALRFALELRRASRPARTIKPAIPHIAKAA